MIVPHNSNGGHYVTGFTFKELAEFRTVVLFPWNIELTTFAELYTMAVPMFLPDRHWVARLWPKYPSAYALKPNVHETLHNRPDVVNHPFSPYPNFDQIDLEYHMMYYWTQFSEFYRYPAVQHFTTLSELFWRLETMDPWQISQQMTDWNRKSLVHVTNFWVRALGEVLPGVDDQFG